MKITKAMLEELTRGLLMEVGPPGSERDGPPGSERRREEEDPGSAPGELSWRDRKRLADAGVGGQSGAGLAGNLGVQDWAADQPNQSKVPSEEISFPEQTITARPRRKIASEKLRVQINKMKKDGLIDKNTWRLARRALYKDKTGDKAIAILVDAVGPGVVEDALATGVDRPRPTKKKMRPPARTRQTPPGRAPNDTISEAMLRAMIREEIDSL